MTHAAATAVVNNGFPIILTRLATDLRKQRSKAVIIIHRPAVKRMVVALGALDAHAHENLSGVLGQF